MYFAAHSLDGEMIPQTVFALRGSDGFSRDRGRRLRVNSHSSPTHFDQKKTVLGDTCSRLVQTKWVVASSNINIYNRKSTFVGPDGSSGQLAIKHATGAVKSLFGVSRRIPLPLGPFQAIFSMGRHECKVCFFFVFS